MHPGAGSAGKRWPVDGFATVAREVGRARSLCVVVHEGPADGRGRLAPSWPRWDQRPSGSGSLTLEALAGVLAGAVLYVGNDSGVSHLAAAVGAPGVVLFTRALLGWRPWAAAIGLRVVSTEGLVAADLDSVVAAAHAALT